MKPIYECLDYLLNHLHDNRFKPEGKRIPFDVDNVVMPALSLKTHEEFKGLMDMLIEDKMALTVGAFSTEVLRDYCNDVVISPKGIDLKTKGGYTQKDINLSVERNRLKAIASQTLTLTWILAIGAAPVALLALVDLYWNYRWFRLPMWWGMVALNIVVSVSASYLTWIWLQKKQLKATQQQLK